MTNLLSVDADSNFQDHAKHVPVAPGAFGSVRISSTTNHSRVNPISISPSTKPRTSYFNYSPRVANSSAPAPLPALLALPPVSSPYFALDGLYRHARKMAVREISSAEFYQLSRRTEGKLLVVKFTATWCGPCRRVAPQYEALAQRNPDVEFTKVWTRAF